MPLSIALVTVFIQLGHSVSAQHYEEDLFQRFVGDQDILLTRGLHNLTFIVSHLYSNKHCFAGRDEGVEQCSRGAGVWGAV